MSAFMRWRVVWLWLLVMLLASVPRLSLCVCVGDVASAVDGAVRIGVVDVGGAAECALVVSDVVVVVCVVVGDVVDVDGVVASVVSVRSLIIGVDSGVGCGGDVVRLYGVDDVCMVCVRGCCWCCWWRWWCCCCCCVLWC